MAGGGQSLQLFNVGLKLARIHCGTPSPAEPTVRSSDFALPTRRSSRPGLEKLHVSGCGLVSNELLSRLSEDPNLREMGALSDLKTLVFLSYDDSQQGMQTCNERILFETLQGNEVFFSGL